MSETEKRKIRVFIASPGDLVEERRKFRDAITVLNIGFGDGANVEFIPLGWEDTLASTGRRSQGVINQDIDACDVFILTMHRRWGQYAPDAAPYSSYTEEEFHRALERWKKSGSPEIFVFFKRVDAASEADPGVQLSKVIKFRQHLEETRQILYRYFDSPESFLNEVDTHLRAYAKGELPKAEERDDAVVLPIAALEEVEKAKQVALQKTEEARQANDKAEIERLKRDALELQMAKDAAKLAKEGKIEFAREKFTKLVTETTNLRILYLGYEFFHRTGDLNSAFRVLEKWLTLSGAENKTEETAVAFGNLGILYRMRGDLDHAEEIHKKALVINEELDRKDGIAITYSNLGIVYEKRGDLENAEKMYEKALVINEELGRITGMAIVYGNLGIVYEKRGDFQRAEEMYRMALAINEALGRKEYMANQYGNLGNLYATRGDLDLAEEMYKKVLAIDEILGRKESIANAYSNLGIVYKDRGDVKMVEEMYQKAIVLFKEIGSPIEKEVTEWLRELRDGESSSEGDTEA
ncbi:tetratricopeptide repeat protein [Chlorobaculum thiosulfatiphilum]|uniref:Tetratricopeptide repeat protein n=1 Tax=Chlorobaculum thiosulfatiphilum TaxID=115852 RepID=A0A5C4S048_CHLTI|nr:tetratricopeptide repeat protein [Chlorobaculum thiosulfatiphilum]TNJ36790.1 tetratricopeptide repeat protein [Chlorobaculum thiosulfatiphilum]